MNTQPTPVALTSIYGLTRTHQKMNKCKLPRELIDRPPNRRYHMRPNDVPYSKRLDRVLLESPHIAEYIRELQVYDSYEGQEFWDQNWIGTDHTLPRLLPKLTNLTRIKFQRLNWDEVLSDLRRSIYSVLELPSLTYVELEKATFVDIEDLKDFRSLLCHAKYSTSLSLNGIIVLPYEFSKHKGEDEDPEAEAE